VKIISDPAAKEVFRNYPKHIKPKMKFLRQLIINTAKEIPELATLEETLKWGEPSYLTKNGSTIRIDWKPKTPEQYAVYFKCTSTLVTTFRQVFGDTFDYEKNRAICFGVEDEIPVDELKRCLQLALTYHSVKHLPRLGV